MDDLELATTAYVGGHPLVVTLRTMRNLAGLIGTNQLFWQTEVSGPETRVIVAPNRDTFYSVAVLDLRGGPLVLTLPEITDRYVTYQFLDAWTESFAYLGSRETGGRGGSWLIFQQALFAELIDRFDLPSTGPIPADHPHRGLLEQGARTGMARITAEVEGRPAPVGGWTVVPGLGRYGDDLLLRALVAQVGWGANVDAEAVYPVGRVDATGDALHGRHTYRITFPPGGLPPVDAFWSLTVYGADLFFTEHPTGRYSTGSQDPDLVAEADGSVVVVLAHEPPDGARNWLPVPADAFVLMTRLYLPGPEVLDGTYQLPAVERIG